MKIGTKEAGLRAFREAHRSRGTEAKSKRDITKLGLKTSELAIGVQSSVLSTDIGGKEASVPRGTTRKTGRPLAKDANKTLKKLRPWIALGMSERTWYRRQAEQRAKEKQ